MFHQLQIRLGRNTHWIGRLGLFGSIGWAIIVPTLLGMSVGLWVDTLYPGDFAWTSLLLPLGLFLGCVNAGYWFQQDFTPKD
jgi:ATP synthase protein I